MDRSRSENVNQPDGFRTARSATSADPKRPSIDLDGRKRKALRRRRVRRAIPAIVALTFGAVLGAVLIGWLGQLGDPPSRELLSPDVSESEELALVDDESEEITTEVQSAVIILDDGDPEAPTIWEPGTADLSCNLVVNPLFDGPLLLTNFYAESDEPDLIWLAPGEGLDRTGALAVGDTGQAGTFGEILPVEPGETYVLAAYSNTVGDVQQATLRVEWFTQELEPVGTSREIDLMDAPGAHSVLTTEPAPARAMYGVVRIAKGPGDGILFIDELVAASETGSCLEVAER